MVFGDADTGWTTGHVNKLLVTSDSGDTWSEQAPPGNPPVWFGLATIDAQNAWVCGQTGNLGLTSDGGVTWSAVSTPTSESLNELFFVSSGAAVHGWAVADNGVILHSDNGGTGWATQAAPAGISHLFSVHFADLENGWAVGEDGVIVHTTSAGN